MTQHTVDYTFNANQLQPEHLQEWLDSGVDESLIHLNVRSVSGLEIFDTLYPKPERVNSGALTREYWRKWYRCEGATGWIVNDRIKQTSGPPILTDEKGEQVKYLSPKGGASPIVFLKVTPPIWQRVSEKSGIPMPKEVEVAESGEAIGFWEWVEERKVPVVPIEGEKKAGCLLTLGFAAISVPGINMGYRVTERDSVDPKKAIARELHPDLKRFDDGRDVTICFDYRPGDYYQSPEFKAAATTARLFANCDVRIARLPGPQKGADDFAVAGGDVGSVLSAAESLKKTRDERLWRSYKGFSPDLTTNSRYFDAEAPENGKITAIKSGLGTGKTEYIRRKVASDSEGVQINIGYRNSLLLQQAAKWDSWHLDEHDGYMMFRNPNARLSLCFDSLLKICEVLEIEDNKKTLILDEAVSALKHLLCSRTLKDKRLEVLEKFRQACQKADRIILLDGNLSDWAVNYVQSLCGKPAVKIENTFQGDTPPVFFIEQPEPPEPPPGEEAEKINPRYLHEWFSRQILNSPLPAIATDNRVEAETLAELLEEQRGEGILLTSKTVTEDWAKEFLADPDAYIRASEPTWLIFSPTAESGIDISIQHYFSDMFCWFFGVIGVDECLQMSRRVRHPGRIAIVCAERGIAQKDGDAAYHKQLAEIIAERASVEGQFLSDAELTAATKEAIAAQAADEHFVTWTKIKAKDNLERRHLREFLFKAFEGGGYRPQLVYETGLDAVEHFKAKEETKDREAKDIFNAEDISLEEALEIERCFKASWPDRCKAIKARLKARLPGIENSDIWTWEFVRRVRFDERLLLSQLEANWLFHNQEDAEYLQRRKWKNELRTFLPDLSDRWLKLRLLKGLGIEQFLDPDRAWTADSPEVRELVKRCKKKSVANVLGHPGKSARYSMRYLNKLLGLIGITLEAQQVRGEGGKQIWTYRYHPRPVQRLTKKGGLKFAGYPQHWEVLSEFTAARMVKKVEDLKWSETSMQSDFEAVTDGAKNIQIQQPSVTNPDPPPEPERGVLEPEPIGELPQTATEDLWGWVRRGARWFRCRVLGWCEYGTRYRLWEHWTAETWGESFAFPEQIQWDGTAPT